MKHLIMVGACYLDTILRKAANSHHQSHTRLGLLVLHKSHSNIPSSHKTASRNSLPKTQSNELPASRSAAAATAPTRSRSCSSCLGREMPSARTSCHPFRANHRPLRSASGIRFPPLATRRRRRRRRHRRRQSTSISASTERRTRRPPAVTSSVASRREAVRLSTTTTCRR